MIGYCSTNSPRVRVASFRDALIAGQAPDGGLFMPESVPPVDIPPLRSAPFGVRASATLATWLEGELTPEVVEQLCGRAFDFPVPILTFDSDTQILELFHGPTAAFKDFGARFLAQALGALRDPAAPLTVLVATSGDTGAAVAQAFAGVRGVRVVLLFPAGRVSPFQELQLTAVPENVTSLQVDGTFDDCQTMVRAAFADAALVARLGLIPANSINVGRLLPQATYYMHAALEMQAAPANPGTGMPGRHRATGVAALPLVCVPSGNLGNLTAGLLAKRQGAPIGRFLAATNRNDGFAKWIATGRLEAHPAVATPSNAMDVGNPSNAARIRVLYEGDLRRLRQDVAAEAIDDETTLAAMRQVHAETGRFVCPHTAVALAALQRYRERSGERVPALVLATAHPAKFADAVRTATGQTLPLPPALARLESLRRTPRALRADPAALIALLRRLG